MTHRPESLSARVGEAAVLVHRALDALADGDREIVYPAIEEAGIVLMGARDEVDRLVRERDALAAEAHRLRRRQERVEGQARRLAARVLDLREAARRDDAQRGQA